MVEKPNALVNLNVCMEVMPSVVQTSGTFLFEGAVIDGLEFSVVTTIIFLKSARA